MKKMFHLHPHSSDKSDLARITIHCEEGVKEAEDGVVRKVVEECGHCGKWEAFQQFKLETPYVLNSFPKEESYFGSEFQRLW